MTFHESVITALTRAGLDPADVGRVVAAALVGAVDTGSRTPKPTLTPDRPPHTLRRHPLELIV